MKSIREKIIENEIIIFNIPLILFIIAFLTTDRGRADYFVLLGTLLIAFILVPTLLDSKASIPRTTSVPAFIAVILLTIGTADAGLLLSAGANVLSGMLWLLVIIYRSTTDETP